MLIFFVIYMTEIAPWPSGKALGSDPKMRKFESYRGNQKGVEIMIDRSREFDLRIKTLDQDAIELLKKEKKLLSDIKALENRMEEIDHKKLKEDLSDWEKSAKTLKKL